jgi:predicted GIY-YIG superfamily endonuclease
MLKREGKPTTKPAIDRWFVYMVRCADGSLYTGVAKVVARRCRQHNAGTGSKYTRSRLPVELVYQEAHPGHGAALKRESAIKALDRRGKLALLRPNRRPGRTPRTAATRGRG